MDDTILLMATSLLNAKVFKMVLDRFLSTSRVLTNVFKSHISTWNTSTRKQRKIGNVLGYKVIGVWQELKYVDIPI